MGDFVVQECCVHGTDLESHGPTSILCDDPLPLLTTIHRFVSKTVTYCGTCCYANVQNKDAKSPLAACCEL